MMGTRPQTIGYAITDSPAGLAAWMLGHPGFSRWTYSNDDPEKSADEVLDDVTLYWLTNSATSSGRLYWEYGGGRSPALSAGEMTSEIALPVAITVFPLENYRAPETWARRAYRNLIYFHEVDKGGHFAAWEQPELFSAELRAAFKSLRQSGLRTTSPDQVGHGACFGCILIGFEPVRDAGAVVFRAVLADLPLALDFGDFDLDADNAFQLRVDIGFRGVIHRPWRGARRFVAGGEPRDWVRSQSRSSMTSPCRAPDDGIVPCGHDLAGLLLGRIPGGRHIGLRALKDDEHAAVIHKLAPLRIGAGDMGEERALR